MNAMNVVFLFSDQHRRDAAGCYGHPLVQTPNLDRLAATGARFTQAYALAPICGPCRSALITGRHVHRCGALTHGHMKADMGLPTMGTVFRNLRKSIGRDSSPPTRCRPMQTVSPSHSQMPATTDGPRR